MTWSLHDDRGRRKYLVSMERKRFLQAALDMGGGTATFCAVLVFSGARISEVLALTPEAIDDANGAISFKTLKRRRHHTRAVPVPRELLLLLDGVHFYRRAQLDPLAARSRIWSWSRTTAWRRVKSAMGNAALATHISKPKALRHAFGVEAYLKHAGLTMISLWLGHADIRTTSIYTTVIGEEERAIAERTWEPIGGLLR